MNRCARASPRWGAPPAQASPEREMASPSVGRPVAGVAGAILATTAGAVIGDAGPMVRENTRSGGGPSSSVATTTRVIVASSGTGPDACPEPIGGPWNRTARSSRTAHHPIPFRR